MLIDRRYTYYHKRDVVDRMNTAAIQEANRLLHSPKAGTTGPRAAQSSVRTPLPVGIAAYVLNGIELRICGRLILSGANSSDDGNAYVTPLMSCLCGGKLPSLIVTFTYGYSGCYLHPYLPVNYITGW